MIDETQSKDTVRQRILDWKSTYAISREKAVGNLASIETILDLQRKGQHGLQLNPEYMRTAFQNFVVTLDTFNDLYERNKKLEADLTAYTEKTEAVLGTINAWIKHYTPLLEELEQIRGEVKQT